MRLQSLTVSEILQIEQLIVPLCNDSEGVLNEGDHNQESTDGGQVSSSSQYTILVSSAPPRYCCNLERLKGKSHGFNGSPALFRISSSLLVCCLS